MSNNFQEYVAYLDTHNAEPKANPDDNATNDVIVPCRFPNRMNVAQISLGSLEIPLAQYNIEAEWNTLQFDEGLDLYVMAPEDEGIVQLVINEHGVDYVAQLPPRLNPVTGIEPTDAPTNTAVFTTQYPHQLSLRGFFTWGEPMKLIDTPLNASTPPGNVNQLTEDNAALTVLSATQFRLTWGGPPLTFVSNPSAILGYVSTPSLPSPVYLAELVTLALAEVVPGHWRVTYDPCTGKFKLCWVGTFCEARDVAPATLVALGNNSLGHIMGFGCASVPIPLPDTDPVPSVVDLPRALPNATGFCVQSIDCSPCRSQAELDVGNYSPDGLMTNLVRQLNRFYFDPGCNYTASAYTLYYSTQCGACRTLVIPFGLYSPDSLAAFLTANMVLPGMEVSWDINTGQFRFASTDDFGLEFDANLTPANVELAYRLGFYPISYRNNNVYTSITPFYLPTKGCCGTSIPDRHLSYVYTFMPQAMLNNQKRFMVEVSKTRSIQTVGPVVDNGDGTITITTAVNVPPLTNIAHGFQVLDVVEVTVMDITYELVVTKVDAYNQFTVELGSLPASVFTPLPVAPNDFLCLRLSNAITTNLYFSCLPNNVLARTLGFNECDYLWSPSNPTTWIAPAMYCLDYPNYVLVELTQPIGATHNMHAWTTSVTPDHTDTLTTVLAKVILYPQFRMERSFPYHMIIPDLRVITRVQIRILNPDHTLYKLHNRDWSFTLVFHAVEKTINQLCY